METIETLNNRLKERYGTFEDGRANFRLIWSGDQLEVREGNFDNYSDSGIYLGQYYGTQQVRKYQQFEPPKYILERLLPVEGKGLVTKTSYEPLWVWGKKGDPYGEPVHPTWEALEFVIWVLRATMGRTPYAKYKESFLDLNTPEAIEARVKLLETELFGNETETGDALAHHQAIVVPRNYGE